MELVEQRAKSEKAIKGKEQTEGEGGAGSGAVEVTMGGGRRRLCSSTVLGAALALISILLALVWAPILDYFGRKALTLLPGTMSYENWHNPPVPMHMDFYFFNWTNPHRIATEKPHFVEMGPYRYNEKRRKVNITWNGNDTVTYRNLRQWFFSQDESSGSHNDLITTVNAVALAAARRVRYKSKFEQRTTSLALTLMSQGVHVTKPVRQLLFDGYSDPLVTLGHTFSSANSPFDRFGWFYKRNGSYSFDGTFTINTGVTDMNRLGVLERWNYNTRTSFYPGRCGNVYGGSGDLYPPGAKNKHSNVSLYSADICRSLTMTYAREEDVQGVPVLRFEADPQLLDNGTQLPGNECFCNGDCVPSGLLNLTRCRFGMPAFVSFPHFHNADPFYLRQVDGLSPDAARHTFFMSVEPTMGYPLDMAARIQVNLLVEPSQHIALFDKVPHPMFLPVLWVEQRFALPPDVAASLRMALLLPTIGYTVILICFLVGVGIAVYSVMQTKKEEPIKLQHKTLT
ncbi:protein croquemort isoform X2 [Nilaparvata lugens]|uniref:protein croquemort isoform X2 n=1 Tax=Nilaparvata lugens TaxID=108931 RepID=UPI00193E8D59|nr:protein croquemort isoform X2 [Nilaparvata lugens]